MVRLHIPDKGKFVTGRNRWVLDMPELEELKDEYMSYSQPSGFLFANEYLGGYLHWKKLINFKGATGRMLRLWREELEAKIAAEAVQDIINLTKDLDVSPTTRLSANKWILDHIGTDVKIVAPKGRTPITNREQEISLADEDYKRLIGTNSDDSDQDQG